MRRLALPVGVSFIFVVWSPFIGEIRNLIRNMFPNQFVTILTVTCGLGLVAAAGSAFAGIRDRRLLRYAVILLSVALATWYAVTFATGNPDVDAVERFHFLEYGLVGFLFYRALLVSRLRDSQHHSRAGHPAWRRCASLKYSRYSRSSRLASRAPRSGTDVTNHGDGTLDAPVASLPSLVILTLLCGAIVGTAEEWVQWLAPRRVGEARDVVLNLYAVMCGIIFGLGVRPPLRLTWRVQWGTLAASGAVALAAFAVFYDVAHLGYTVTDGEVGQFRSAFTHDELLDLQRERAAAWSADPPRELPLIGKEDFYLTEGGWRVQYRNDLYARQRFSEAWLENRILEKYWDPFLELHSFSSGDPHRWPSAQRAEVDTKRRNVRPGAYLSPVGAEVIVTWPTRAQFWRATGAIELGLVSVWLRGRRRRHLEMQT